MPFKIFDRNCLKISSTEELGDAINRTAPKALDSDIEDFSHQALPVLADAVVAARRKYNATVLLMFGANMLTSGNALYMIELMKRGLVSHLATNGMGSVYDFEYASAGGVYERKVADASGNCMALWDVTAKLNDIITDAAKEGLGWGEAVGKYIWENNLPYREQSVQAMAYHLGIPFTVHVGFGCDVLHQYPNCNGEAMGATSHTDFLIYTNSIANLEHGVFLDFGSAVAGPEVYLKALAMARNVAKQHGEKIVDFHTAVFDILPINEADGYDVTPPKSDPRYYFRPWKTILARSVADGGHSHYIRCPHDISFPNLSRLIFNADKEVK
ncbi:MAG: hypothetical protein ACI4N6_03305 [Eubacteriales bacterium]